MNINLHTPINQLGYGIAGLNIARCLSKHFEVSLFPIGPIGVTNQADADVITPMLKRSSMLDFDAPSIKIWHQHDMADFVGKGLRIGYPFFELSTFTEIEKHHLNSLDGIFVASSWAKDICEKELEINKDNIFVVPLGVDINIFKPSKQEVIPPNKNTVFFNCGKWEIRKGHDVLVTLFNSAFTKEDNVELWMLCDNLFLSEEETQSWVEVYKGSELGDKIKIIPRVNTQQEVYNIMSKVDCGVFPSKAEGWNLELLELMACGKNVIATNCSAHTEFCNEKNCMLIDVEEQEDAYDGKWFHGTGKWGKVTENFIHQGIEHMKEVHRKKQNKILKLNIDGISASENFSWENSARKITEYVQILQNKKSR